MRHAEKLKGFNKQAAAAVKVFKKVGLPQSFIDEFNTLAEKHGADIVSDGEAMFKGGRLWALGDHGLDDLGDAFDGLAEKNASELFAAGLTEFEDEPMGSEVFWPSVY